MDYNKVKLGLIGKFKVWRVRREAEKDRAWRDNIEGEISEVDYSEADRLEADLLNKKRIRKATRDAQKLFRGYNNKEKHGYDVGDGLGEADFIEEYIIQNGLKQKALPEPEISRRHAFMAEYPVEKSAKERAYEKASEQPRIYYRIGDIEYELPSNFLQYAVAMQDIHEKPLPLEEKGNGKYILTDDQMRSSDKYDMLKKIMDLSLNYITASIPYLYDEPSQEVQDSLSRLCRTSSAKEYVAKKLFSEGRLEDANILLKKKVEEILKFKDDILKGEQEGIRE